MKKYNYRRYRIRLDIIKALVDMMGGKINASSTFGKGYLFVVNIPQKIRKLSRPMSEKKLEFTFSKIFTNNSNIQQDAKDKTVYGHKKVLILDDNKLNIKVARGALDSFNFELEECYDGEECIEKIHNGNEYDLILMDIMIPNMNRETALEKLKENPNFTIPTIALTVDAVAGAKEKYLQEGFVDYIAKPFSKEQIKEKLDQILIKEKAPEESIESLEETPKYDPNVDRFKDAPAYVIGEDKKEETI